MIARAASSQPPAERQLRQPAQDARDALCRQGSPITPVDAMNTSAGWQPTTAAAMSAHVTGAGHARSPGERIGIAAIDDECPSGALGRNLSRHQRPARKRFWTWSERPPPGSPGPRRPAERRCDPCSGCPPRRSPAAPRPGAAAGVRFGRQRRKGMADFGRRGRPLAAGFRRPARRRGFAPFRIGRLAISAVLPSVPGAVRRAPARGRAE